MWLKDDTCRKVVEDSWKADSIGNIKDFEATVARCGSNLSRWNKENNGNLQKQIKEKRKKYERLLMHIKGFEDNVAVEVCRKQLNELEEKEEIFKGQKVYG